MAKKSRKSIQAQYDKCLKEFDDLNRKAKYKGKELGALRRELAAMPAEIPERPDEILLKDGK